MAVQSAIRLRYKENLNTIKELFLLDAMFTKKADVYAAGIIILELISLCPPGKLYHFLWPSILEIALPLALKIVLKASLADDPEERTGSFVELQSILKSDGGKGIGCISKDKDLLFEISSGLAVLLSSTPDEGYPNNDFSRI
jgi:hypothetical protein